MVLGKSRNLELEGFHSVLLNTAAWVLCPKIWHFTHIFWKNCYQNSMPWRQEAHRFLWKKKSQKSQICYMSDDKKSDCFGLWLVKGFSMELGESSISILFPEKCCDCILLFFFIQSASKYNLNNFVPHFHEVSCYLPQSFLSHSE